MKISTFSEPDVRKMIRLLGETAALVGGHTEKKRFLMNGLCKLLEVDSWVWALGKINDAARLQRFLAVMHDGFSPKRFAALRMALEMPAMGQVTDCFFSRIYEENAHFTMIRDQVDPQNIGDLGLAGEAWNKADVGSLLISGYPVDLESVSVMGFYRRLADSEFTERERKIAHIILSEVSWLHLAGWPEDRGGALPKLSPRQRSVLNLLLDGHSRKEIADLLEIRENTVAGYTREVYRHFDVSSHPQLIRKFFKAENPPQDGG